MSNPIIIIGSGYAGWQLVREIRKLDTHIPLWIVTADDGHFYSKPQLSVALTRQKTPEMLITTPAEQMAQEWGVTLYSRTRVTAIQPEAHRVIFQNTPHAYQALVLALGASPARLPLSGNAQADVLSVNHIDDYAQFRNQIAGKKHITLIGAGLIGCEFANDLANTGHSVNVITMAATPVELLLPEPVGRYFQTALSRLSIRFYTQCTVKSIDHAHHNTYQVTLANGTPLHADLVLSATGLKPMTALALDAHISTQMGIRTNRFLETSEKDVYALGDCAEVGGFVLPYITPIQNCALALAKTLTGYRTPVEYPAMPITLKTPACPVSVCPPPKQCQGEWEIDVTSEGMRALFYENNKNKKILRGFVLTEGRISERSILQKAIPALI